MNELRLLVEAMADDLDHAATVAILIGGAVPPLTGAQVREFYRRIVRTAGVDVALADARTRYAAQVLGDVLPLPAGGAP